LNIDTDLTSIVPLLSSYSTYSYNMYSTRAEAIMQ